ncbi:hypothetical protein Slin15195_G032120 [Septoria linicola]|uniref:Uncharacterized protein n=1 Tax=Septoria linicola TaxID=215465 RepID=A0A9Q9EI25_9PEZI|nr:hypothetical protein Slin14017_G031140 [Septoria linicola]USW49893.1 hypothetical protein Slin15195_G032120 [Septoria linicola]
MSNKDGTYDQSKYWRCSTCHKFVKKERHDPMSEHSCVADEKQHWFDSGFLEKHQSGWTKDEWTTAANIFCCRSRYGAADSSRMPWCFTSCKKADHKDCGRFTASGRQHTRQPTQQIPPAKTAKQPHSLAKSMHSPAGLAQLAPRAESRTSQQFGVRQHEPPYAGTDRDFKRNRWLTQTGNVTTTAGGPATIRTNVGSADLPQVSAPALIHWAYAATQQTYGWQFGSNSRAPDYDLQQQSTHDTSAAGLGGCTDSTTEWSGQASSGVLAPRPIAFAKQVSDFFLHTRGPQAMPKPARSPVRHAGVQVPFTWSEPHGHTLTQYAQLHSSSGHRRRHDIASLLGDDVSASAERRGTGSLEFNAMSSHMPHDLQSFPHPPAMFDDGQLLRHHKGFHSASADRAPPHSLNVPAPTLPPFNVMAQGSFKSATKPKNYVASVPKQEPLMTETWPSFAQGYPLRFHEQYH